MNQKHITIASWVIRGLLALAFVFMAAVPKFTGDQMSVEVFEKLGAEPAGRFAVGIAELAAAILLIVPKTAVFGGLLTVALMLGALGTHIVGPLGFPMDPLPSEPDPAPMGVMAIVFLALGGAVVYLHRKDLPLPSAKAQPPAQS